MRTQAVTAPAPWEFRFRALVIGLAFGAGFFFGYALQFALFGRAEPTFVMLGQHSGRAGIVGAAWFAAALTAAAWLIRWWASSYHAPGVVLAPDVVADKFTAAGPYRHVRNPLYLANCFLALGIGLLGPPV